MTDEIKNEELCEEATSASQEPAEEDLQEECKPEKEGGSKKKMRQLEAQLLEAEKTVEQMKQAAEEQNDKYLRLAAEYDNFRKRSAKEREHIYADAYADALAVFLPVIDNLERATQYSDGENVTKGVAMTLKGINDALERLGITEIEAEGKPFDPELHNAVLHIEDESLGEGVVAEVLQKGYRKGERVLRYAMVKVAN